MMVNRPKLLAVETVLGVILIGAVGAGPVSPATAPRLPDCDDPSASPWVSELRDRTLAYNDLAAFAVERWGAPVSCDGEVTTEFDGASYGFVELGFEGGVTLHVETMPIESSVVELRSPEGFGAEEPAVIDALRAHASHVGVDIDWENPELSEGPGEEVRQFRDPVPGLNASGSLITRSGILVAVRFSMAL